MAGGTSAVAIKQALIALVADLELGDAVASYGPPPNPPREYLYTGRARGGSKPLAMRAGGRVPRDEQLRVELHIVVTRPDATEIEQAEQRAVELGELVIDAVAAAPTLNDLPGLLHIAYTDIDLASGADDDAASAWLILTFTARSNLK